MEWSFLDCEYTHIHMRISTLCAHIVTFKYFTVCQNLHKKRKKMLLLYKILHIAMW